MHHPLKKNDQSQRAKTQNSALHNKEGAGRSSSSNELREAMGLAPDDPRTVADLIQAKKKANFQALVNNVNGKNKQSEKENQQSLEEHEVENEVLPAEDFSSGNENLTVQKKEANAPLPTVQSAAPLIVENGKVADQNQMTKSIFLQKLEAAICLAVDMELTGLPFTSNSCPYIRKSFLRYNNLGVEKLLDTLERYAPEVKTATTANEMIAAVVRKVQISARKWARNGDLSALPPEMAESLPTSVKSLSRFNVAFRSLSGIGGSILSSAKKLGGSLANMATQSIAGLFFKAADGGVTTPTSNNATNLGDGKALPSDKRTQMETAMGSNFGDVRLHTGSDASNLAQSMNAKAFTYGNDIVMDDRHYSPETPEGDLLLAHELAHVQQQSSGSNLSADTQSLEADADQTAAQAMIDPEGQQKAKASRFSAPRFSGCKADPPYQPDRVLQYNTQFWGDPFRISIDWWVGGNATTNNEMVVNIEYKGDGQASKTQFSFREEMQGLLANPVKFPNPKVISDSNGLVQIDLFNDGAYVFELHSMDLKYDYAWSPPSRIHNIYFRYATPAEIRRQREPDLIIKSRDAVPQKDAKDLEKAAKTEIPVASGVRTFNPEVALTLNISRIESLLSKNVLGKTEKEELQKLKDSLLSSQKRMAGMKDADTNILSNNLRNLEDALIASGQVIGNLEIMGNPAGFLPDIAKDAAAEVSATASPFVYAITTSYQSRTTGNVFYGKGSASLLTLPSRLSALYLKDGAAIDALLKNTIELRQQLQYFRIKNGRKANTRPLDSYLEIGKTGLQHVVPSAVDVSMMNDRRKLHDAYFTATDTKLLTKVYTLATQAQTAVGVYGMLTLAEQFRYFYGELGGVIDTIGTVFATDYEAIAKDYMNRFEGLASRVEKAMDPNGPPNQSAIDAAVSEFNGIVTNPKFKDDVQGIQDRIKTISVVDVVFKVVLIVAAAALTAGAAGAAVGAALEGAGVVGLTATTAIAFSEALAFTFVSRLGNDLLLGGNKTSFLEDLGTNFALFFILRSVGNLYVKLAERMKINPKSFKFKAGQFGTAFTTLEVFAITHHLIKEKKMMTANQFLESLGMNAVLMATLHMGRFITEPLNSRITTGVRKVMTDKFAADIKALEALRVELGPEIKLIESKQATETQVNSTLAKIRRLFESETALINKASGQNPTSKEYTTILEKYARNIAEADAMLSKPIVDARGGNQTLFRQMAGDTVSYKDAAKAESLDVLRKYYEEIGGKFEVDANTGIAKGIAGTETLFFVPESIAGKGGLVGWANAKGGSPAARLAFLKGRLSQKALEGLEIFAKPGEKPEETLKNLEAIENKGQDIELVLESLVKSSNGGTQTGWQTVDEKTDPSKFLKDGEAVTKEITKGMHPSKVIEVAKIAEMAMKGDIRFELILRILDPLYNGPAFKVVAAAETAEPGIFSKYNVDFRGEFVNILRDPSLTIEAKKSMLMDALARFESQIVKSGGIQNASLFRLAESRAAVNALSTENFGGQIRVDSGGLLFKGKESMGTFRQLIDNVVATNNQMIKNGIGKEIVISIGEPGPSGSREVFLLARPMSMEANPVAKSPVVPLNTAGKSDGIILDIGSGTSAFALELVPSGGSGPIVQTEYGKVSFEPGLARRDLAPHLNSIPKHGGNSVAIFGDPMQTLNLVYGPNSIRFVAINNVNAGYTEKDYDGLAKGLLEVMQEGGRVELQWDMKPEKPGTPGAKEGDRNHITADKLMEALQRVNSGNRKFSLDLTQPPITDYEYSIEPSRVKGGSKKPTTVTNPVPTHRGIFTFGPFP